MQKKRVVATLLASASVIAMPGLALAQSQPAGGSANQPGLEEIVVTANRVETSAQDTPISLNAYTGDDLQDQGVNSVRDLAVIDPSVNVSNSAGAGYVAVRGIASTDVTEIGDPSVPVARDGFFVNRSFSLYASMYDVARVEVLKGPQGTLNGRNSTGGLISIITRRPDFQNGGYANFEAGNFNTLNGEIGANLALSDSLAVRASGTLLTHDGYRQSTGPARFGDDENFASGRIQAAFRSGGFSAWASYQHDYRDVNGDAQFKTTLNVVPPSFGDARFYPSFVPTYTKLEGDRVRWEASYDTPGGLNFIYSGGYDKQNWQNRLDATGLNGSSFPANRQFRQIERPETWNHEFRVSNDKGNRLFFQAGYFRFSENNVIDSGLYNLEMQGPLFGPGGILSAQPNADQSNRFGIKFDYGVKTRSQAVFGQIEYDISEQLELSLGARYTWDKKDRVGQAVLVLPALAFPLCGNTFPAAGSCPPFPLTNLGNGSLNDSQPTWHVGLNYRPNDDTLIYFKYDRGYKSGGFNSNGSAASVPYGAEQLDAFEIGAKNSFMDNKLQLNLAGFFFDYRGYQASQSSAAVGGGNGIFNVGSAKIFGLEGSVVALLGEATRINLNAAFLDTQFGQNISVRNGGGTSVSIGGNTLPNAPAFSTTAGIEHDFALGDGKLSMRVDARYSSSFYYSVFNGADTKSNSYALANASITYKPGNGIWKVQGFIRNIFDKQVLSYASQNFVSNTNTYQFQPPRTYGVRVGFEF